MHHIRECMPEIKSRISSMLGKYESELLDLGEPIEETQEARVSVYVEVEELFLSLELLINIIGKLDFEYYNRIL